MKTSNLQKKFAFLFALFILSLYSMRADASIYSSNYIYVTGTIAKTGSTAELRLNMHNTFSVSSWQCDLYLPEGITFKSIALVNDRHPKGYEAEVTTVVNGNGSVTITCKGSENINMTGTDGAIATVTVDIADTVTSGKYLVCLRDIYFDEPYFWPYTEFNWTIVNDYIPFVEDGKSWTYKKVNSTETSSFEETYSLDGDTVIGSYECLRLYVDYYQQHVYTGAMFEEDGKVYYIEQGSTTPALLYDFSSEPGTTIKVGPTELTIKERKLYKYRGKYWAEIGWQPVNPDFQDTLYNYDWYEGIGIISGSALLDIYEGYGPWCIGGFTWLVNCKLNGQIIYDDNEFWKSKQPVTEEGFAQMYYPQGTKWTEIRLDTMKYNSWYSKVGDEWVPNFETVEYHIRYGITHDWSSNELFSNTGYVYSNGPEWSDSLALTLMEYHSNADIYIDASFDINYGREYGAYGRAYQFDWVVGKELYYQEGTVEERLYPDMTYDGYSYPNETGYDDWGEPTGSSHLYGTIEEIKEGYFGGVKSLKYVDLNGIRIIQGIGVTEWNDGECIFGPLRFYDCSSYPRIPERRHYRSMLVHFERDGEVLYDVWPEKVASSEESVTFTTAQMATIVLPTEPDASKGKYYRLDRCEDGQIIFEQELHPQAHIPYIIVPSEDFSIDPSTLDLAGLSNDTVSIGGISFIGSYTSEELNEPEGFYIDIIDTTPDCGFSPSEETEKGAFIGALRAYLQVSWDEPYNHGGSKAPGEKLEIKLKDKGTNIASPLGEKGEGTIYDLSGRHISSKPAHGVYIKDGRKMIK